MKMEKFCVFVILTNFLSFGKSQLFGGESENKFPQIFESVDSDISEYYSGEYFDYEDLLPSESALSEKQIALRSFYKKTTIILRIKPLPMRRRIFSLVQNQKERS